MGVIKSKPTQNLLYLRLSMETNTQVTLKEVKTTRFNYSILAIIVLIAVVIGETWYISNLRNIIKLSPSKQTNAPNLENLISIKGVVRTAGLSGEEKEKVGLSDVNFQITNIEDSTQYETNGYFLKKDNLERLVGKCVQIIGTIPNEWSDEKIKESYDFRRFVFEYHRIALIPTKIVELNYSSCQPYHDLDTEGNTQLQGTIVRNQRGSPFIDNDYEIRLVKPTLSVLGFENIPQDFKLIIKPAKNSVWPNIESQIGKETIIVGYVNKSGYAKGDNLGHFSVTGVRPLVSNRNVPASILPEQVDKTYTFNGIEYAIFQKGSMNVVKPGDTSGILYANKDNNTWKIFTRVKELSKSKNNPYLMDYQNGKLYVLVVDTNGAGSGEGIGKLMSLTSGSITWNLESCFYYGWSQERFYEIVSTTKNLPEAIRKYIASLPQNMSTLSSDSKKHCNDFQLIQD